VTGPLPLGRVNLFARAASLPRRDLMSLPAEASSLEAEVARFERFAHGLVLLEPLPRPAVRAEVDRFVRSVEQHLDRAAALGRESAPRSRARTADERLLGREHQRFRTSLAELRGLLAVVEADDHGGHRQALGQYGKILAEALRVHLNDERRRTPTEGAAPVSGKHN
jgi:hypothetical protein